MGYIRISRDSDSLQSVVDKYPDEFAGWTAKDWLASQTNFAITDGSNWGLFHRQIDKIYTGHYFFTSRGKEAKTLSKEMLSLFFSHTGASILRGLTPIENRAARWMSRQVGFKSLGEIDTDNGPCELFVMTKDQ